MAKCPNEATLISAWYLKIHQMKKLFGVGLFIILCILSLSAQDQDQTKTPVTFTYGGYAKLDFMVTQFNDGQPTEDSPLRDIHVPALIPVGGVRSFDTHMHVKESRFYTDFSTELFNSPIHAYMELDFLLSAAGDERVTNSYNPRIRHFYFEYKNFLFGQDWSTFMIVILPDDLDFTGAAEGLVFNRQPLIRYTAGNWQFAIENPETTFTPNGGGSFIISSGGFPDVVVRRNFPHEKGTYSLAAMSRIPRYYDDEGDRYGTFGFGVTGGGKINIGQRDDLRFMATYGRGMGRYIGLAFLTSAVIKDDLELETRNSFNGYLAYLHHWNDKWRSSFNAGYLTAENPAQYTGPDVNKSAWSASGNIIFQPAPQLYFGAEIMHAVRELEGGTTGSFTRFQISAKYSFEFKTSL